MQPVFLFLAVAALSVLASNTAVLRAGRWIKLPELASSGLAFLVLGAAVGPRGTGALAAAELPTLTPLVVLGLGLAGVLVGLNLDPRVLRRVPARAYLAAGCECAIAFFAVAGPLFPVFEAMVPGSWRGGVGVAALLGAAASVSSGHFAERALRAGQIEPLVGVSLSVLAMLHDVVALSALAVALAVGLGAAAVASALVLGAICGLLMAFLVRSSSGGPELMAVVLGSLALVSGLSAFLRVSALLSGVVCGAVLTWVGGRRSSDVYGMLLKVERPAFLLLLFVIGVHVDARDPVGWGVAAAFVLLRAVGKLVGGKIAARAGGPTIGLPRSPGLAMLAQGAIALCIAIEYRITVPGEISRTVLDVTAWSAVANELLAMALFRRALAAAPPVESAFRGAFR